MSDTAVLTRKLGAVDYNPTRYVAEISQRCVGKSVDHLFFISLSMICLYTFISNLSKNVIIIMDPDLVGSALIWLSGSGSGTFNADPDPRFLQKK